MSLIVAPRSVIGVIAEEQREGKEVAQRWLNTGNIFVRKVESVVEC